jgi:hypothetical protein
MLLTLLRATVLAWRGGLELPAALVALPTVPNDMQELHCSSASLGGDTRLPT